MSKKKQTRRAISIKGITYARLASHTENISGYIEALIAADLDAKGVPVPDKLMERKQKPSEIAKVAAAIFSF